MLKKLSIAEVKHIAEMARAARDARDQMLGKVHEEALGEPKPARGEHNPAAGLGLDPLPPNHPVRAALRQAITALPSSARWELRALMWVGRGDYATKDLERAVADASTAQDDVTIGALVDQSDLHEFLMKGLYELELL
jgi:hypothetical protein